MTSRFLMLEKIQHYRCVRFAAMGYNSLDYSPHKIAGVTIDDLELFMKYR